MFEKLHRSEQVLERFASGAAFHKFTQWCEFAFSELAVEFEIQLHPLFREHVGEQMFDVQSRALHLVFCEVISRGGDDFEDGLHSVKVRAFVP